MLDFVIQFNIVSSFVVALSVASNSANSNNHARSSIMCKGCGHYRATHSLLVRIAFACMQLHHAAVYVVLNLEVVRYLGASMHCIYMEISVGASSSVRY